MVNFLSQSHYVFLHFFQFQIQYPMAIYESAQIDTAGGSWDILSHSKLTVTTRHSQICSEIYLIKSFQTHLFLGVVVNPKSFFRCDYFFFWRCLSTLSLSTCWFSASGDQVTALKTWRNCSNVEEKDGSDCKYNQTLLSMHGTNSSYTDI